jgi:hypothetical protein
VVPFAGKVLVLAGDVAAGEWWRSIHPPPPVLIQPDVPPAEVVVPIPPPGQPVGVLQRSTGGMADMLKGRMREM